jgi:hypothetical protein
MLGNLRKSGLARTLALPGLDDATVSPFPSRGQRNRSKRGGGVEHRHPLAARPRVQQHGVAARAHFYLNCGYYAAARPRVKPELGRDRRKKDKSLARYPEFAEYKRKSMMFIASTDPSERAP